MCIFCVVPGISFFCLLLAQTVSSLLLRFESEVCCDVERNSRLHGVAYHSMMILAIDTVLDYKAEQICPVTSYCVCQIHLRSLYCLNADTSIGHWANNVSNALISHGTTKHIVTPF